MCKMCVKNLHNVGFSSKRALIPDSLSCRVEKPTSRFICVENAISMCSLMCKIVCRNINMSHSSKKVLCLILCIRGTCWRHGSGPKVNTKFDECLQCCDG